MRRRTLVIAGLVLLAVLVAVGVWMMAAKAPEPDVGDLDLSIPAAPSLPPVAPEPTPDPLPIPNPANPG